MPAAFCAASELFQGEGDPDAFVLIVLAGVLIFTAPEGASLSISVRIYLEIWGYLSSHWALVCPT